MQNWLDEYLNAEDASRSPAIPTTVDTELPCASCVTDFGEFIITLLASIPHPVLLLDSGGVIRLCNPPTSELGPSPEFSAIGETYPEFLQKIGLPPFLAERPRDKTREVQVKIHGTPCILISHPIRLRGRITGSLIEFKGLSAEQNSPQELASARQQLQELLSCIEISSDGFCIMDSNTTVLFVNHVYERITGLKREEIIGRNMRDLVAEGIFDRSTAEKVLETQKSVTLTLKLKTGKHLLVSGSPLFDSDNDISRVVCSIRDITELNRLQNELESVNTLKARYEEELVDLKGRSLHNDQIIFRSESLRGIVKFALRVGSVDSTILLQSESGSGKELFADFIQRNSSRCDKPFLKINCAAIPEHLLESELFGYTRGAFTGANREGKVGIFEAASQGTLLLDEVGELPKSLQVKLLRVLQEKTVRRIGDTTPRPVDIRILASTNRDLAAMVESGEFREDLYYRLNVVPIRIPPLRERKEDIFPLVQAFLEKFCKRYHTEKSLHPRVMPALLEYSWPGNVRELENMVERLVVTSPGSIINLSDLPADLFQKVKFTPPMKGKKLKDLIDDYEAMILSHYFSEYRTTREVAAALGIHQSNVVRKLQRLNLQDLGTAPAKAGQKKTRRAKGGEVPG